ncbi:hypothetical protein [Roseobacter phage RDJL6]|nr:hypothetical protein [Roseobacter phage RDJL6]
MTKETFTFETSIPVENFLDADFAQEDWKEARNEAFDLARDDTERARLQAIEEFKSCTDVEPTIVSVEHCEFDSGNISHANSYYTVVVSVERETMQTFIDEWFGEGDSVEEYFHEPEPKLI